MSLEQLLVARALIAVHGEKSQMNWWDSDGHSHQGQFLLGRIFPRTASWAATELAILAATEAHKRYLPPVPAITLFDLGEVVNRALADLLLRRKTAGEDPGAFSAPIASALDLAPAGLVSAVKRSVAETSGTHAVCVGDVNSTDDPSREEVWGRLVAGYQFSSPGSLTVPYLRVV